jgi:hypothetical protein
MQMDLECELFLSHLKITRLSKKMIVFKKNDRNLSQKTEKKTAVTIKQYD